MKVLLLIPVYNEEKSVGKLLSCLNQEYEQYDYIVINDCSKDGTVDVVQQYTKNILNLPINLGLSGAIKAGMMYAAENDYDVCVQIDGDGQHRPEYIQPLIDKVAAGANIAIGSRFLSKEPNYKQTFLRRAGANWLAFLAKLQCGITLTDPTSGMRAYDSKVFKKIVADLNSRPEPDTVVMFAKNGYVVEETPVIMNEREAGKSHLGGIFSSVQYMLHTTIAIVLNPIRKVEK